MAEPNTDEKPATPPVSGPKPTWYRPEPHASGGPWEISICGDLTDRQSELLEQLTEVPRGSRGILYFDSCGGSVYTGLSLGTLIRIRRLNATAVVLGECSSAALLPFAACKRRWVTHQSTLLFHPMRWQSDEDVRLEEATEWARHFRELEGQLDELLTALFCIPSATLTAWTRPGRFVSGKELAAAGIASLFDPFRDSDPWKTLTSL